MRRLPHILTISQHRQIKFLQFWAAVFGASLEDHNERFTRNDLKNLREWSVKFVLRRRHPSPSWPSCQRFSCSTSGAARMSRSPTCPSRLGNLGLILSFFPKYFAVLRNRDVYPESWFFKHPGSRIPDPKTLTNESGEKNSQNCKLFYFKCWRKKFGIVFKEL